MNSLKDPKLYEDLRRDGSSKEKSARVSNAIAARGHESVSRRGGESGSYDDWTVPKLKARARELGITRYSTLTKSKLIERIRQS
jgi:hypothetical protein